MSNDKMREEFEAAIALETGRPVQEFRDDRQGESYASTGPKYAWWGWKASREAVEQSQISPEVQAMLQQFAAEEAEEIQRAESFVRATGRASISALQRNFKISYGGACRLMDKLVSRGIVSPIDAEGRRSVLPDQVKP